MADRSYSSLLASSNWIAGDRKPVRGQEYLCLGVDAHECKDGRLVPLARLQGRCAKCDARFDFMVPSWVPLKSLYVNRRCDLHKSPGARVRGKRGKPAKIKPAEIPLDLFG